MDACEKEKFKGKKALLLLKVPSRRSQTIAEQSRKQLDEVKLNGLVVKTCECAVADKTRVEEKNIDRAKAKRDSLHAHVCVCVRERVCVC